MEIPHVENILFSNCLVKSDKICSCTKKEAFKIAFELILSNKNILSKIFRPLKQFY